VPPFYQVTPREPQQCHNKRAPPQAYTQRRSHVPSRRLPAQLAMSASTPPPGGGPEPAPPARPLSDGGDNDDDSSPPLLDLLQRFPTSLTRRCSRGRTPSPALSTPWKFGSSSRRTAAPLTRGTSRGLAGRRGTGRIRLLFMSFNEKRYLLLVRYTPSLVWHRHYSYYRTHDALVRLLTLMRGRGSGCGRCRGWW
jgi:hypothetical protein